MSTHPFHILVQSLFDEQIAYSEQLSHLLEKENAELRTIHITQLDKLASEKLELLAALNESNSRLISLMQQKTQQPELEGIEKFLGTYDIEQETDLLSNWRKLQTLAIKCQKQNAINGTIIVLRNQAVQQSLSILRGQVPNNHLYDTHGNQKPAYSGGQEIAKA